MEQQMYAINMAWIEVYDYDDVTLTFTNTNKNWEL